MFVVVMHFTSTFEADDERVLGHKRLNRELVATGQLVMAGPRTSVAGGLMVFNVATDEELRGLLDRDPMRKAGMIEDEIFDFTVTVAADQQYVAPSKTQA